MISHHTTLGENVHVHPGVIFGGKSTVGNNCIFNLRATVLNKVLICNDVEVGAISNITKDIMHSGKYVGTVAKRIGDKENFLYEVS
jgi:UDP-3-O-[3-hydroxymyristoyl] glucosamine N-acyltransferase